MIVLRRIEFVAGDLGYETTNGRFKVRRHFRPALSGRSGLVADGWVVFDTIGVSSGLVHHRLGDARDAIAARVAQESEVVDLLRSARRVIGFAVQFAPIGLWLIATVDIDPSVAAKSPRALASTSGGLFRVECGRVGTTVGAQRLVEHLGFANQIVTDWTGDPIAWAPY